jgi:Skp family chaperone for outer membrane proteins
MRTLGLLLLLCLITLSSNAQKFGYIDSDYILKKLPEFQSRKGTKHAFFQVAGRDRKDEEGV